MYTTYTAHVISEHDGPVKGHSRIGMCTEQFGDFKILLGPARINGNLCYTSEPILISLINFDLVITTTNECQVYEGIQKRRRIVWPKCNLL